VLPGPHNHRMGAAHRVGAASAQALAPVLRRIRRAGWGRCWRSRWHARTRPRPRAGASRPGAGAASAGGAASRARVARGSGPDWTASSRAVSATVRAIGPSTPRVSAGSVTGHLGTRPGDGRKPTTLQKLAGLRNEPPRSLPSARQIIRAASAAAAPPQPVLVLRLLPAGDRGDPRGAGARAGVPLRPRLNPLDPGR